MVASLMVGDDTVRGGRQMDTPDMRGSAYKFYSSFGSNRKHGHHCCHPYKRSDRGQFPNKFKKVKPPTFDGELKKPKDAEAWLIVMNKFFELHEYTGNMKARIIIFNLKGKVDIWREDVKQVRDINIENLSWHEFKRLFKNKYFSKRYYNNKASGFYQLKMGSMKYEEYMAKFQELLRYVLYIKDGKAKVQIFFSGFPLAFRDMMSVMTLRHLRKLLGN